MLSGVHQLRSQGGSIKGIGWTMVTIIFGAVIVLLILAVLVASGRMNQKGPHGRGGPLGPPG